jgi:ATP-dependent RNA helicase DeaD
MPTDEDVEAIVAQRIIASLEAHLRSRDGLENERMRRFIPLGRSLAEAEEDSPLIAMLLDDYYQRTLQAAPQSPTGEPAEEAPEPPAGERMAITGSDAGKKRKRPRKRGPRRGGEGGSSGRSAAGEQS